MTEQRVEASDAHSEILPLAAGLLLFAPLAFVGNEIASALRYPDIGTAVLFPPYAALTAALIVCPRRHRLWYVLVGSVTHLLAHWPQWPLSWVLVADFADIVRALVASALIRWLFGGVPRLESVRALALFVISAVVVAPAAGATIGAANVELHGASSTYWHPWVAWYVSNALTGLAMLPMLVAAFMHAAGWRRLHVERARIAEGLLLATALGAACAVAFVAGPDRRHLSLPLLAPLPVLIWAALRFGAGGASLVATVVAFAAIWSVDRGTGPFLAASPDDNIFALQTFVLLTTAPVLCLACIATARQNVVQLYRALLASLEDHVAILDAHGVVLEVNGSWRRFAASSPAQPFHGARAGDDYVAAGWFAAQHGDPTAARVVAGVASVLARTQRRFEIEYDHDHDGRREAFTMTVEALERLDGGAVVTRANVTARRQAQMEIEEQRRQLSHLARVAVLGQLSGAFAHELSQPLTAILSNAEAARHLLRRHPADLEQIAVILREIVTADQRAAAVIQRLRGLLRRGERRLQSIDPGELVAEVLELAHTELSARQVNAASVVESDLPRFFGDKVQLQQVLLNLMLNASEAMSATAESERRLILTVGSDPDGAMHFAVRDSGPGISPALIDRLFEPFVTTKADGLGLGLSISRTIVAAHGGRLWAENNPHGGAAMHCVIPAVEPSLDARAGESRRAAMETR